MRRSIRPRTLVTLCLLLGAASLLVWFRSPQAGKLASEAAGFLLATVAGYCCFRAARGAVGTERLAWGSLATGATGAAVAEGCYLLARWRGVELFAAPPLLYTGWATLFHLVFVGFYLFAFLKPHQQASRTIRPALIMDVLLLGLLLLALHFYFLFGYRLNAGGWDLRQGGLFLAVLLGLGAAAALASCRRQARAGPWKRVYALMFGAVLCQTTSEVAATLWRDPQGAIAGQFLPLTVLAGLFKMAPFALLALAAVPSSGAGAAGKSHAEPMLAWAWRDLYVPCLVLAGLLGIPLLDHRFSASPQFTVESLHLRNVVLTAVMSLYVLLVLIRQFLVQMENRALALDLQREHLRLQLLVENIHDAVITEDLQGRIVFASERFRELFGLEASRTQHLYLEEYIHPEDRPLRLDRSFPRMGAELGATRFEFRGIRKDGTVLYLESSVAPVRQGGLILGFQSVIRDISERRKAEERQRELVQRLEFFVTNMPLGCIVWDLDFRVVEWNNSASRIFGWSGTEVFGRRGTDFLIPPEQWPALRITWNELLDTKSTNHRVSRNLTKDRGLIECEWFNTSLVDQTGRVVAVASMVQDITERKNLEAQLRQSQKMEAVGVLAGGIAHDFNNLLTVILGNLSLALIRLGPDHPAGRGLHDAEKAGGRASELIQQLLGFSRKSPASPQAISLNLCVRETVGLLRRTIDPHITIEIREQPQLWPVEADPGQMHQVLMNLCVNARDAMQNGGRLTVTTANRMLDQEFCHSHPEARPGEFVEVSVSDTGAGIDRDTLARIFEPFFTTKEVGKGTGLGLAMVYGIVKQHGGWTAVESEPGKGSTFLMFLPRSEALPPGEIQHPPSSSVACSETVLLVDDEEMILNLARAILESSGHRVLEAHDGEEAVQVFQRDCGDIDLVLLDMTMPRKSGRDTLAELHRLAPQVPIVISSGYSMLGGLKELSEMGARGFLRKPYNPAELARTVRKILDSRSSSPD